MDIPVHQQIFELFKKAERVLIVLPAITSPDAVASGLALAIFLRKLEKQADLVSSGLVPAQLGFLPEAQSIKTQVDAGKGFVITVDTALKKLEEISYETGDQQAQIFLRSKGQPFTEEDIKFSSEKSPVDLIIILDAASLEHLGKMFEQNATVFYETPKINIDNKAANEYFGSVNLVDVTAASVAEILFGLFEQFDVPLVDEDIATCLLAGIIAKTHSFQGVQTTPQSFMRASQLVALGARQQDIIRHLYKTKPLPLLKLWGRVLARMKGDDNHFLVYSLLNLADLEKSGAGAEDLEGVLEEMVETVSGYKAIALACLHPLGLDLIIGLHPQLAQQGFLENLGITSQPEPYTVGQYSVYVFKNLFWSLEEAENRLVAAAKDSTNSGS